MKKGILSLDGAHCASCAYTIEHVGRKIQGIKDIRVYAGEQQVHVSYDGAPDVLDKVAAIVKNIGYSAKVEDTDAE
jgi:cation transport ATPase